MTLYQKTIRLPSFSRGFHLITSHILKEFPEIQYYQTGILNLFLQHTSASLTINENADPSVRKDFESHLNFMVPENANYYQHTLEGSDDMPAHLKSSLLGCSINIPITKGRLNLGTWQGIYFCEHRDHGGSRLIVLTAYGNPNESK